MSLKKGFPGALPYTLVFTSSLGYIQASPEELWWVNEWSVNSMMLILWCIIKKSTCWSDAWPLVLQRWQVAERCLHLTGGILFKSGGWVRFSGRHVRYTCIWVPHSHLGVDNTAKMQKKEAIILELVEILERMRCLRQNWFTSLMRCNTIILQKKYTS